MNRTGWTDRPVETLKADDLLEEALKSAYDTGWLAAKGITQGLGEAITRRGQCFAELRRRLVRGKAVK